MIALLCDGQIIARHPDYPSAAAHRLALCPEVGWGVCRYQIRGVPR